VEFPEEGLVWIALIEPVELLPVGLFVLPGLEQKRKYL